MIVIDYDDGMSFLIGYKGDWRKFEYVGFDFNAVAHLSDWKPVVRLVAERIAADVDACIARIEEALTIEGDFFSFMEELAEERSSLYYDFERTVISLDEYREIAADFRNAKAAKIAKKFHTQRRRAQFDKIRDDLVLKLLASGRPYVCAKDGCEINSNLTVDHIIALSKGGTDDQVNLQFLCSPHNSAKGDR